MDQPFTLAYPVSGPQLDQGGPLAAQCQNQGPDLSTLVTPAEFARTQGLLRGTNELTALTVMLFSDANVQIIQNAIRRGVYEALGAYIAPQDVDTLLIIMRSYYLQYSKNLPTGISKQIKELNNYTIQFCVPQLISAVKQYRGYIRDASTQPVPIALPQSVGTQKNKQLQPYVWL